VRKIVAIIMIAVPLACSIAIDPTIQVHATIDTCTDGGDAALCPLVVCTSGDAGPGCVTVIETLP
jgi:hypothetical protein